MRSNLENEFQKNELDHGSALVWSKRDPQATDRYPSLHESKHPRYHKRHLGQTVWATSITIQRPVHIFCSFFMRTPSSEISMQVAWRYFRPFRAYGRARIEMFEQTTKHGKSWKRWKNRKKTKNYGRDWKLEKQIREEKRRKKTILYRKCDARVENLGGLS